MPISLKTMVIFFFDTIYTNTKPDIIIEKRKNTENQAPRPHLIKEKTIRKIIIVAVIIYHH